MNSQVLLQLKTWNALNMSWVYIYSEMIDYGKIQDQREVP